MGRRTQHHFIYVWNEPKSSVGKWFRKLCRTRT